MSLLKKLAGETALYGLSSIVGRFLNYLLVPLYTRQFLTGEYGVVSELYAYSGFLMVLFSYRLESAFFRFGTPEEDRERSYTTTSWSLFFSTAILLSLALFFSQPLAEVLSYANHPEYIRWFAWIIALDCLSELPFARLRLEQRPRRFVAAKLLNIGLNIFFNLFWLVVCPWASKEGYQWVHQVWSPDVRVGYVFISNLIASAATLLFLFPQFSRLQGTFDWELWKKMLRYAAPLVIVGFAGIINEMLDRALLTRLLRGTLEQNRAELGIYSANYKLAMLITLFTQAYRYAAEPFFFRAAQGDSNNSLKLQANATKWFTIIGTLGMLGILLYLDIVKQFVGAAYHSGLKVVPILLLANLFLGIYYNFSVWYRLKDRTMTGAYISILGALITFVLNIWWVPYLGYLGAAWATLVCYLFMSAATWWTGRKWYPAPYPLGKMAFFLVVAGGLFAVSLALKSILPVLWMQLLANTVLLGVFLELIRQEWKKGAL
ncbi:MAG: oligosaccharide flippase family protein [Chitinophagales bacterium]|jgi:O-antigen/teichoic acid export membrane protein